MSKIGDIVPGKTKVSKGWKKSGAFTMREAVPESRCISHEHSPTHGSHKRLSGKHNQGARGHDNTLQHHEYALGCKTRTFRKGIPDVAPLNYHGEGGYHKKELGK